MGATVAIGMFDGLHIGHQRLIQQAIDDARANDRQCTVMTFAHHPMAVIAPDRQPTQLQRDEDRIAALSAIDGVDQVVPLHFHEGVRQMNADDFVRDIVVGRLEAEQVIVGANFRFGQDAKGTPEVIAKYVPITMADLCTVDGVIVSSTQIRDAIKTGWVERANEMLGRPHYLRSTVITGDQRGRTLGFPTANLDVRPEMTVPAIGVYAGLMHGAGYERVLTAVSIGYNTTFGHTPTLRVEAHLLDFDDDIYSELITIEFHHHLRGQERYPGKEALIEQLQKDCARTRELMS
ncbi:bifunctional riboflavin kinase/FAD synthetase [Stomatohabitans albus]|uniref:bifunctional riboflavin kinase/FAD synthetase n=1 Tax=Stomatohabitans albus TaxID=3110766 RepID=UPI00300C86ED